MHLHTQRPHHIVGLEIGPILADCALFDVKDSRTLVAAINKNIPPDHNESDLYLYEWAEDYVKLEFNDELDALGQADLVLSPVRTIPEVVAHALARDAAKGRRYQRTLDEFLAGEVVADEYDEHRGKYQVKPEVLKATASPRGILNPEPIAVLGVLTTVLALEEVIKSHRPTYKGLRTEDKWRPVAAAVEAVGSTKFIARDCTARDGHVNILDYYIVAMLIGNIIVEGPDSRDMRAYCREGMRAATPIGTLVCRTMRLFSGLGYTSALNWVVTRFGSYVCSRKLGFDRYHWAEVPEGDDGVWIVSQQLWDAIQGSTLSTSDGLATFGRGLGKAWKLEAAGDLLHDPLPVVGGTIVLRDDDWYFFPSLKRFAFKCSRMYCHDVSDYRSVRRRIAGRIQAMDYRFRGVPIMQAYAARVSRWSTGRPLYDKDDAWIISEGRRTSGITPRIREAFYKAYGIPPQQQLEMEAHILSHDASERCPDWRSWWEDQTTSLLYPGV